jgi:hypothetical protein
MEKHQYAVGDRVEKLCVVCGEERGHVVALLNKRGQVSRVSCPQCGTRSAFKGSLGVKANLSLAEKSAPYDWTRTYRKGQTMMHPTFGLGEVTAVIGPQKIDVLFSDRIRRLIHARDQA